MRHTSADAILTGQRGYQFAIPGRRCMCCVPLQKGCSEESEKSLRSSPLKTNGIAEIAVAPRNEQSRSSKQCPSTRLQCRPIQI